MKRTSARCVIAQSERLKRVMARSPVGLLPAGGGNASTLVDRANLLTGVELLDAERDDALVAVHARGDERHALAEGENRHRPQFERARFVDHINGRAGSTIEDSRERKFYDRGIG